MTKERLISELEQAMAKAHDKSVSFVDRDAAFERAYALARELEAAGIDTRAMVERCDETE